MSRLVTVAQASGNLLLVLVWFCWCCLAAWSSCWFFCACSPHLAWSRQRWRLSQSLGSRLSLWRRWWSLRRRLWWRKEGGRLEEGGRRLEEVGGFQRATPRPQKLRISTAKRASSLHFLMKVCPQATGRRGPAPARARRKGRKPDLESDFASLRASPHSLPPAGDG